MDEASAKFVLRRQGWLADEPKWLQDAVLDSSRLKTFRAGEFTFRPDDDPGGIYGIVDGGFGVYLPSGNREFALAHILRRGIWFGHGPALTGRTRIMGFRAVEPSRVLHLPLVAANAASAQNPEFVRKLGALSERNYSMVALKVIGDLLIASGERRIAATLVRISASEAGLDPTPPWPIRVSQAEIGEMANASRDRINRTLARFEKAGWISVGFKIIEIRDMEALRAHASGSDD